MVVIQIGDDPGTARSETGSAGEGGVGPVRPGQKPPAEVIVTAAIFLIVFGFAIFGGSAIGFRVFRSWDTRGVNAWEAKNKDRPKQAQRHYGFKVVDFGV